MDLRKHYKRKNPVHDTLTLETCLKTLFQTPKYALQDFFNTPFEALFVNDPYTILYVCYVHPLIPNTKLCNSNFILPFESWEIAILASMCTGYEPSLYVLCKADLLMGKSSSKQTDQWAIRCASQVKLHWLHWFKYHKVHAHRQCTSNLLQRSKVTAEDLFKDVQKNF